MADNHGEGEGDEAEQEADKNWMSTPKKPKSFYLSPACVWACVHVCVCMFERKCQICMFTLHLQNMQFERTNIEVRLLAVEPQRIYQSRFLFNLLQTFISGWSNQRNPSLKSLI